MTKLTVTIELWDVFQAWDGQTVKRWAICHERTPLINFKTQDEATAQATAFGWEWEVVEA